MYATLYAFLRMSPADQARVTHLDLAIVDADCVRVGNELGPDRADPDSAEEYPGESAFTYPQPGSKPR